EYRLSNGCCFISALFDFNPDKAFWKDIKGLASDEFYQALDYVGLDCFPDVFRAFPLVNEIPDTDGVRRMLLTDV
ncbi:MAG: hypothetical protein ABJA70_20020, partial [Chryseolinea sp.]